MTARLTVVAGPSGVGKGSVIAAVLRDHPEVWLSVSVTTRAPRHGEQEGIDYFFVDDEAFAQLVADGDLLEHDAHMSASYGTPRRPVADRLASGRPVLLEIDLHGARQVRAAMPDAQLVLLKPPSLDELSRRLLGRGTESPERAAERLSRAVEELAAEPEFDAALVNDDLEDTARALVALIRPPGQVARGT